MLGAAIKEFAIVVGMALVLSFIVKTWLLQAFYIPSGSMEDTLVLNDRVIVSKLTPGPIDLKRGDIIVFADPGQWLDEVPPGERGPVATVVTDTLTFVGLLPGQLREPPHQAGHRAARRPRRLLRRGRPDHHQRRRDQGALPQARRRGERAGLRHHRAERAGVGDGRPPLQLRRLARPRRPGERREPGLGRRAPHRGSRRGPRLAAGPPDLAVRPDRDLRQGPSPVPDGATEPQGPDGTDGDGRAAARWAAPTHPTGSG